MVKCPNCESENLTYVEFLHLAECNECGVTIWEEDILQALKYPANAVVEELLPIRVGVYGFLKADTPFAEIFPQRIVPLTSTKPVVISNSQAPPCFIVDGEKLSALQITQLGRLILRVWGTQCQNLDDARSYVKTGLPLASDWFLRVETSRPQVASQRPIYNQN
jgi:hypothetical protein